jgi:hypothetical protein
MRGVTAVSTDSLAGTDRCEWALGDEELGARECLSRAGQRGLYIRAALHRDSRIRL